MQGQLAQFQDEMRKKDGALAEKDEAIAVLTAALQTTTEKLQVHVADGGTVVQLVSEAEDASSARVDAFEKPDLRTNMDTLTKAHKKGTRARAGKPPARPSDCPTVRP